MAYVFNGELKIITFDVLTPNLDMGDLWSRYVEWLAESPLNRSYLLAMRTVGGDSLPGSKKLGITYFMRNGWKIKAYEASHIFTVNGNVYAEDGSSPFTPLNGSFNLTIVNTVSNLVDSTVQQLPEIEYASFNNRVTYDGINGTSIIQNPVGTLLGTPVRPLNNLMDCLLVAEERGFNTIDILSPLTVASGQDVSEYIIISDSWQVVTLEPGSISLNTEFHKISLYGELSGEWNLLVDCWLYSIRNFLGWMRGGSFETISLAPYINPNPLSFGSTYLDDVVPMYANTPAILNMAEGTKLTLTGCSEIIQMMDLDETNVVVAGLRAGELIIDSSCTGGDIHILGMGNYTNNSLLSVDDSGLNNENTAWGAVASVNNDAGTTGNKLNTASSGGVDLNALAEAVRAELETTTIPVNTKKINDVIVTGTGADNDPWGPA